MILASNHRSFLDPFAIGCCLGRPIYFVAKQELFKNPLLGWLLNCLGAFPIKRGASDEESVATSLALLERGEAVVIFPEGTRIRTGSLAPPKRGVGRMALQSGSPVVPIAVTGSERARKGWRIRPVKVHIRCGPPLTFPRVEDPSPFLARRGDRAHLALRGAPVGVARRASAAAHRRRRRRRLDGHRRRRGARARRPPGAARLPHRRPGGGALAPDAKISATCRASSCPPRSTIKTVPEIELAGVDLVVLAVPCASLPAAVGEIGARMGDRSAVLVTSKGLVPPMGTTPAAFVSERVRARAVATLAGPAHAREAIELGASVVLATRDADLRRQLHDMLEAGGLTVEATDDVTGTELAACAKNAAALGSAAAAPRGANLAGAAAGHIFSEIHELALASGGRSETFAGLAGAGDLVATAIAEGSRNRRAGEMVGAGVPAGQVQASMDQTAESLATVPLLGLAFERQGIDAPVTTGLRRVLDGESSPEQWLESVRSARPARRRTHAA